MTWKTGLTIASVVFTSLTVIGTPAGSEVMLRGSLGFSGPTGDVGDDLIGGGLLLGGEFYIPVNPMIYLGGSLDIGIHQGQQVSDEMIAVDFTDAGAVVTFEVGALFYLIGPEGNIRPYVRGTIGRGGLAWNYSDIAEAATGVEEDAVGFFIFSPAVGFDLKAGEKVSVGGELRGVAASYDDETTEGFEFDLDGGNFIQVRGFVTIRL